MESNLILKNIKEEKHEYKGRYLFQSGLLDNNNEEFPLTDYMESEIFNINAICSKGYYYINIKNDRNEVQNTTRIMDRLFTFIF